MYRNIKRGLDILLSLLGIILLAPVFLILAVAVKVTSPGPVLFRQRRIGIHKSTFYILKFRTMRIDTPKDCPTHLLEHPEQYITPIGNFLRKTSLDELPQLFNILAGSMSVVGPRPVLTNLTDWIALRDQYGANDVRPGLTGWAQINGRDELSTEEKARLDGEYVKKMSFLFDLRCFLGTVPRVFCCQGVVEGGTGALQQAMEEEISAATECDDSDNAELVRRNAGSRENSFATVTHLESVPVSERVAK